MPPNRLLLALAVLAALGCGHPAAPPASCPTLHCQLACDDAGTKQDDNTRCATCLCARAVVPDGSACPALHCAGSCGLDNASDPITGCPTCTCCNPADCVSGCHGFGADGCPTCGPC